jgi:hypothetical protein
MNVKADFPITCSAELEIGRLFGGAATIVQAHTGGTMLMKGPTSDLQFSGAAKIIDGTVTYMNNTFNIVNGYVRQPSGKGFNPFISLTATAGITQTQGATLKDSITVKLTLSGEVSKLEVHLTSSPISYSESEILSLLTFGMTSFENSTAQGALVTGASSLLTRSVSGYASRQAQKLLGLEQVQIQGNYLQGGSARQTTAITLKKRFGPNLSLTYRRNLENNLKQEGILSWKFLPMLYLEGASDIEGNAGIDLKFKVER